MRRLLLLAAAPFVLAGPARARADPYAGHAMGGMASPAAKDAAAGETEAAASPARRRVAKAARPGPATPATKTAAPPPADPHAGHAIGGMAAGKDATTTASATPGAGYALAGTDIAQGDPVISDASGVMGGTAAGKGQGASASATPHAGHAMPGTDMAKGASATSDAGHAMGGMTMPAAGKDMDAANPVTSHAGQAMPGVNRGRPADPHAGHGGHAMDGMASPAAGGGATGSVAPHAGHVMPGMDMGADKPADPHAGHDMAAAPVADAAGTALEPGDAPAPAAPADRWADRYYGMADMMRAREIARREHGGGTFGQILFNLAEYQIRDGRDGYRWDGEGWFGGDIDRLTVKTEGEGDSGGGLEAAEVQALWSHALDAYWNLQAGARIDARPGPTRTYATIGVEGLAPYWFEIEGALFLSDKGDLLGRAEAYYDQRITQRLILQPRAELNFAAQAVAGNRIGAGLVNAELGLRLRYEFAREFAPYVGVSWDRRAGDTARLARAAGDGASETSLVAGVRFWF